MQQFVHLHTHSDYSLLDGAQRIPAVVRRARELGMPALALTDHGNLFGAIHFYKSCRQAGIQPILGMEAYVALGSCLEKPKRLADYHHLVLLARDLDGYHNLMRGERGVSHRLPLQAAHRCRAPAGTRRRARGVVGLTEG